MILFSPCSTFCLYKVFTKKVAIRKVWEIIFTLLAKSSIAWFPLITLFGEKDIRKILFQKAKSVFIGSTETQTFANDLLI